LSFGIFYSDLGFLKTDESLLQESAEGKVFDSIP